MRHQRKPGLHNRTREALERSSHEPRIWIESELKNLASRNPETVSAAHCYVRPACHPWSSLPSTAVSPLPISLRRPRLVVGLRFGRPADDPCHLAASIDHAFADHPGEVLPRCHGRSSAQGLASFLG